MSSDSGNLIGNPPSNFSADFPTVFQNLPNQFFSDSFLNWIGRTPIIWIFISKIVK